MDPIFVASDLDRTIVPNGDQPESPEAREYLRKLARHPSVTLAYVSGRDQTLQREAIKEYELPLPDYAVGDVGTTIYQIEDADTWQPMEEWANEIGKDWSGKTWPDVKSLFNDIPQLRLQEDNPAKQGTYKVSYYTDKDIDRDALNTQLESRAKAVGIDATFIWSVDEAANVGLLDVLPRCATKLHAIQWLMEFCNFNEEQTVFAGDSGNDMPALISGLQAVVVKNALPEIKEEALTYVTQQGIKNRLYIAQGNFLGMNGNYTAGVLEGIAHFFPEVTELIT